MTSSVVAVITPTTFVLPVIDKLPLEEKSPPTNKSPPVVVIPPADARVVTPTDLNVEFTVNPFKISTAALYRHQMQMWIFQQQITYLQ